MGSEFTRTGSGWSVLLQYYQKKRGIDRFIYLWSMHTGSGKAVLLLGSNLGDRVALIEEAERLISRRAGSIYARSSFYKSEPWGNEGQPHFINRVVVLHTMATPDDLLDIIQQVERQIGRRPSGRWQPRVIDVDILFYDDTSSNSDRLVIPHPLICQRRFVLIPLNEIMPEFIHPQINKSIKELLNQCNDAGEVVIFQRPGPELAEA